MSETIIFRQEGTNCVVYCPVESDNRYIPAVSLTQQGVQGELLQIATDTPVFGTQGEAWAYHVQTMQEILAGQHAQINQRFEAALTVLKKRARIAPGLALVTPPGSEAG
jgi:hypothetical protein